MNAGVIEVVPGLYGNVPFNNVGTYLRKELAQGQADPVQDFINRV